MRQVLKLIGAILTLTLLFLSIGYFLFHNGRLTLTNNKYKKSVSPSDSMQVLQDSLNRIKR